VGGDDLFEAPDVGLKLGAPEGFQRRRQPAADVGNGDADGLGTGIEAHDAPPGRHHGPQLSDVDDRHGMRVSYAKRLWRR